MTNKSIFDAALGLGDFLAQGFLGIPIDYRAKTLITGFFMQGTDAQAPTLYQYDNQGYMRPADGRTHPLSPQEQAWMDAYNRQHSITLQNWNDSYDRFFLAPLYMPDPYLPLMVSGDDIGKPLESIKRKIQTASLIRSPVVLDLDGDGVETMAVVSGAWFDHDADGFAERSGWVGADDGLLVRDLDGSGTIDTGRELFGSETLLPNGRKAPNGFDALQTIDVNADGCSDTGICVSAGLKQEKRIQWPDASTESAALFLL